MMKPFGENEVKNVETETKVLSLKGKSKDFKIALLRELGYNSDGMYILKKNGDALLDKYTNEAVCLDNFAILTSKNNKVVILDCNPLSISSFLEDEEE